MANTDRRLSVTLAGINKPGAIQPDHYPSNQAAYGAIHNMDWIKEKMYQARLQRNQIQSQGAATARGDRLRPDPGEAATRFSNYVTLTRKLPWLAGGMVLGSMIAIMVWQSESDDLDEGLAANGLSGGVSEQHGNTLEPPSEYSAAETEELRKEVTLLTQQVQVLTASVSDLKTRLLRIDEENNSVADPGDALASDAAQLQAAVPGIVTRLEALPPHAAVMGDVSTADGEDTDNASDTIDSHVEPVKEITPASAGIQAQETIIDKGPWVINLASLPRKADAERFMENAESRGVAADIYQVTVREKIYWRIHVPGFATAAEAKARAGLIKEKLGLKDVWIAKR